VLAKFHTTMVKAGLTAHPTFVTRLLTLCTTQGTPPAYLAYVCQVFNKVPSYRS
jgi:hypothetical protein